MKFEQRSQFHQPNGTKRKATFAHGKKMPIFVLILQYIIIQVVTITKLRQNKFQNFQCNRCLLIVLVKLTPLLLFHWIPTDIR